MRNVKTILASGLIVGSCLFSALPAMADTVSPVSPSASPNAVYWSQIKQLRQQDKSLAEQLQGLRENIRDQRKADRQQKNFNALLSAVNDQISMENDYSTALACRLKLSKDSIQLGIDRQAKNKQGIVNDLQSLITDLQNQINIRQQLTNDAQKILADLGGSSSGAANGVVTQNE